MFKYLLLSVATLMLVACSAQDEQYYRTNPEALQTALKSCPATAPSKISCTDLQRIANEFNPLVYSLQSSPQGFGSKIMELQVELTKQQELLLKTPDNAALEANIKEIKQQLAMRLAIVKWLESPER